MKERHDTKVTPPTPAEVPDHPAEAPVPGDAEAASAKTGDNARPKEYGGRDGPEPTRYGDWEKKGRCIDF